ncbi:MAG: leucine-rich repeat domain-containing protein [Candidatus Methanomethylophilaceae archaeon]|nr:leucine-rich repeat domain-containing protein [Candidatus Methanomethylophilaceae archaeon]
MKDAGTIDRHTKLLYATVVTLMVFAASCFVMTEMTEATDPTVATITTNVSDIAAGTTTELIITCTSTGVMADYALDDAASGTKAPWKDYRDTITAISIVSDGGELTSITKNAFYNITKITTFYVPESIEEIDGGSFRGCVKLESFEVDASNLAFLVYDGVLYSQDSFMIDTLIQYPLGKKAEGQAVTSYGLPAECLGVADRAFEGASSLTSITLSAGLKSIGAEAFNGCSSVTNIFIPRFVTSIGEDAFFGMTSLVSIEVDRSNTVYKSYYGALYKSLTDEEDNVHQLGELIFCPIGCEGMAAKSNNNYDAHTWNTGVNQKYVTIYVIPYDTLVIHGRAFYGCNFTDIDITTNVTAIGEEAFMNSLRLVDIYIPSSVTSIGKSAFEGCTNLASVYMPAIDLDQGREFAGCKSLMAVQIAGYTAGTITVSSDSLPSVKWNDSYGSLLWKTWELDATAWTNVDSTDSSGQKGTLDLNKDDNGDGVMDISLNKGWLYYRQAVAWGSTEETRCNISDWEYEPTAVTTDNPDSVTVYYHRITVGSGVDSLGCRTDNPCVSGIISPHTLGGNQYLKISSEKDSDWTKQLLTYKARNIVIPEEPLQFDILYSPPTRDAGFGTGIHCMIHFPEELMNWGSASYSRQDGSILAVALPVNSFNQYVTSVQYTTLQWATQDSTGYYLNSNNCPIFEQPMKEYGVFPMDCSLIDTLFLRDHRAEFLAFPESQIAVKEDSLLIRHNPQVLYIHALKTSTQQQTSFYFQHLQLGSGSVLGGRIHGQSSYDCAVLTFSLNVSGLPNTTIYRDGAWDFIDLTTNEKLSEQSEIQRAHLYLRNGSVQAASGNLNEYVTWHVVDKTLIVHTIYGDLLDNIANGRDVIIPDMQPGQAPWYNYLANGTVKYIVVSEGITSIGDYAFYTPDMNSVVGITLPNGLTDIGAHAFGNTAIRCLYLPEAVTSYDQTAVQGCGYLTEIVCNNSRSTTYWTENGLLYKRSDNSLVSIPAGLTEAVVSAFCSTINEYAAIGSSLKSINLNNVTTVANNAFTGSALTSLVVPKSGTIGDNAFSECSSLRTVSIGMAGGTSVSVSLGDKAFYQTLEEGEQNSIVQIDLRNGSISGFGTDCLPIGNFYRDGVTPISIGSDYSGFDSGHMYSREAAALRDCSEDGGLKYYFHIDGADKALNIVYIEGNGVMLDYTSGGAPWYRAAPTITSISLPEGIVSIGDNAFQNASGFNSLTIADSCESIGEASFQDCSSLSSINLKHVSELGESAFKGCTGLTGVVMEEVTSVPASTFQNCTNLSKVNSNLPGMADLSNVGALGSAAFMNTALTSVDLSSELSSVSQNAFKGTALTQVILPSTISSVASGAFDSISGLDTVSFQGSSGNVTIAADSFPSRTGSDQWYENGDASLHQDTIYAFSSGSVPKGNIYTIDATWGQCGDSTTGAEKVLFRYLATTKTLYISGQDATAAKNVLEEYTSATNNQFIGKHSTVTDLDQVEKVVIRNVGTLGAYMFYGNGTLKDLYFDGTVIGQSAMQNASNLESVDIVTATTIDQDALKGTKVSSIDLSKATTIGDNAFKDVTALTKVDLSSATSIGTDAFSGCTGLTDVTLKQGVAVGSNAFKGDTSLTNAKIDLSKIGTIGNNAFQNCTGLTSAPVSSATTIGDSAFAGCTGIVSADLSAATSVGASAFDSNLTSLTLSSALTSVGANAFGTAAPAVTVGGSSAGTLKSGDLPVLNPTLLSTLLSGSDYAEGQMFIYVDTSAASLLALSGSKTLDLYGNVLKISPTQHSALKNALTVTDSKANANDATVRYFKHSSGWSEGTSSDYTAYINNGTGAIIVSGAAESGERKLYDGSYSESYVVYNMSNFEESGFTTALEYKGAAYTNDQVKNEFTVTVDGVILAVDTNYIVSMSAGHGNKDVGDVYVVIESFADESKKSNDLILNINKKHITVTFPEHINYGDEPIDKLVMNGAYETAKVIFSGDDALQELSLASKYIGTTTLTLVGPAGHPMSTANYNIVSYFGKTEAPFTTQVTIDAITFTVNFYKYAYNEETHEYEYQFAYYIPVEAPNPIQLPSVSPIEGFNFAGWYKGNPGEEGSVCIGWTGEYYAVTENNLNIYAKYLEIGAIAITTWYHVDDQAQSQTIDPQYGYYVSKSSVSEDSYTYVIAKPVSGYSVRISVQHAAVEALSDGIFKLVPMKEMFGAETEEQYHPIVLDIYVLSVNQGIGDFRVAALTNGNAGALIVLTACSDGGLMEGTLSFGGVYTEVMGSGSSAVRVYGAISNTLLKVDSVPVAATGISVEEGSMKCEPNVVLKTSGQEIYHIYAMYTYEWEGTNTVTCPAMYGNNVILQST